MMDDFLQFSRGYGYNISYPTISDDSKTLSNHIQGLRIRTLSDYPLMDDHPLISDVQSFPSV